MQRFLHQGCHQGIGAPQIRVQLIVQHFTGDDATLSKLKVEWKNFPNRNIFLSVWKFGPIPKGQVKHDNVIVSPYDKHRTCIDSPSKEAS
jgi:hypothetical protein